VGAAFASGEERRGVPLRLELAEGGKRPQFAPRPLVERRQKPVQRRFVGEWNGQEIRGNIPWLIGYDAQLHYKALRLAEAGQ
jgi:hypothetical protein